MEQRRVKWQELGRRLVDRGWLGDGLRVFVFLWSGSFETRLLYVVSGFRLSSSVLASDRDAEDWESTSPLSNSIREGDREPFHSQVHFIFWYAGLDEALITVFVHSFYYHFEAKL